MADLLWAGDERADGLLDDRAVLDAMVRVEQAWLDALVASGVAPPEARIVLAEHREDADVEVVARGAESSGNPVPAMLGVLRQRVPEAPARWLHRGLTSQDVIDTALVLSLRDALDRVEHDLHDQLLRLADLAERHRDAPAVGRTLTQHAVPLTLGARLATWITVVADASEALAHARSGLALQVGGAAGTLAAVVELTGSPSAAHALVDRVAAELDLPGSAPWHTARARITRVGDALVTCTDAWGRIATDVATGSRPEVGELAEGTGGGSSTMPHKRNPVLSVLLRRAALTTPALAATLHLAAATAGDERPDGAWHAEWATLRLLGRRTVVAASQATDLLAGLRVDVERMRSVLAEAAGPDGTGAEQQAMLGLTGRDSVDPAYTGLAGDLTDAAVRRARQAAGTTGGRP